MKKRTLFSILTLALVAVFAFSLTACNNEVATLETLKNEYGIVVDGGSFEEGSTLVSNEIVATTEEAAEVLAAIADQNYDKDGKVYIFDIYVTKDGKEVQPNGKVKVSIPIPNVQAGNYLVFHIKADNSVENLVPTVADGKISFETSSFSYFAIAEAAPAEHVHSFGGWTAEETVEDKHFRECECGEVETADCTFDNGVVTKDPTHIEPGTKLFTCTVCGHTHEEDVPATTEHEWGDWAKKDDKTHIRECKCGASETKDHNFDAGTLTKEPTHLETGVKTFTCADCGFVREDVLNKTPEHTFGEWKAEATVVGKHYRECACGEQETADCAWDNGKITTEPTHYEEGVKTFTCTVCGNTKTEAIAKTTAHEWGDWAKKDDKSHIRECKCGASETKDHNFDAGTVTKEPTHLETGVKTFTCADCGFVREDVLNKTPEHTFGEWKQLATVSDKHYRECACGEQETADCAWDNGKITTEPTHYEEGVKTFTCTVCGNTKTEAIAKTTAHEWGDWAKKDDKTHIRECKCGASETKDHNFDAGTVTKEPTHLETGVKTFTCADCGFVREDVLNKTPEHTFGEWKAEATVVGKHYRECACGEQETADCAWDNGKITTEPTHYEEGVKTFTCTVCGNTKTEAIDKTTAHEWGDWAKKDDASHIRECKCSEIETKDHTFDAGTVTKEPTHLETGIKKFTCTDCGFVREDTLDKTPEHTFGEWKPLATVSDKHYRECACGEKETADCTFDNGVITEEPTHVEPGTKLFTCTVCGHTNEEDVPATTEHEWGEWVINKLDEANTHIRYCICDETQTAPHSFDEGVVTTEATHTSKGVKTFSCGDCGYTYDEEIPTTPDHKWTDWSSNGDGTHTRACRCNANETQDCTYDDGVVTEEPTHVEPGTKLFTCTVCGHTNEEDVPATTEHEWGEWVINKLDEANTHIRYCICNESQTAPHNFNEGVVTTEATHTSKGIKTFTCGDCGYTYDEEIPTTTDHKWTDWSPNGDGTHTRACRCNANETKDCEWDGGVITQEPTHYEEGVKTFTCTVCDGQKTEPIAKTTAHEWSDWAKKDDKSHIRECKCGEVETKDHSFDAGTVTKEPTHLETGVKTFTCADCGFVREENLDKTPEHTFGEWKPLATVSDKHYRECACGEIETGDCTFDNGAVTKEPTHFEEGIKTYTCTVCGRTEEEAIAKTNDHLFGDWYPSQENEDKHERACNCGEMETGDCTFDNGAVTKEPTHFEEGIKTYTCTVCGRTEEEAIAKTNDHLFGDWYPSQENEDKHERACNCGEKETGDCTFDNGVVTKEPTHFEEGIKTYTCTVCNRTKEEAIAKTNDHLFGDWYPSQENEDKHERICKCGEKETADCTFDNGVVTKEPTHVEEGIKTYTCTVCDRTKDEAIAKTNDHLFGDWYPSQENEDKHERICKCGEKETGDCTFDENGICTVCGREKSEEVDGIIIVISGGTATFEGKDTVATYSNIYGENATVYIAQENDVLNVKLADQDGRTFKYWMSATGTIIPDEDFSLLVFRSGYYYPVFEDTDANAFSSRVKIYEGNCEEGILYMSTNSKGDVKYEIEYVNGGHHDFDEYVIHNSQYHKLVCLICGETVFEEHTEDDSEIEKEAGHTEEGLMRYECFCGHVWTEAIPVTDEHTIDYDDWHIVEESKNGQYGKYRVYCKYCDYYEEYWYLGGLDFVSFMDGKMINYQYTYGGKVSHDEYYYSYRNAEGKKIYIWAFQYEYEYSSNEDYNDTYIFMYVDDEDPTTLEPIYLSKSKGDRRAEYLWAIYGYAYDVNGWIETLDYPDDNMGCGNGMVLGNSMSARASVFEAYHDYWAETYNELRIPTSKAYDDLSGTPWEIYDEGTSFQGGYYDENDEYVMTGGRDTVCYVKDKETSYKKYMYVDKATGMTYGYADYGTYYRTVFMMRTYKTIVSPEEFENLDAAGKSVHYSYGDIESNIKSLCSHRTLFNNFTLALPGTVNAFRFIFSDPGDCVDISGNNTDVYYNTAHVYNSGSPITLTWNGEDGIVFDRYEIWDFVNQKWVLLSESPEFTFNTLENPVRDAAYVRVIYHEVDVPAEPDEIFRITVENGYFEIDGKIYRGTVEVAANTRVYVYADELAGKSFEYWLDGNDQEFDEWYFYVTSDITLRPFYVDTVYRVYCEGWNSDSYVSVNGGEMHYTDEFEGKAGETVQLNTSAIPDGECTVFIGWYLEVYGKNGPEYILISDKQAFTYTITGEENGFLYAVWTQGENPFVKKYVNIRVVNGFVNYAGGEIISDILDNAYSAISVSGSGRVCFYDDPTDEKVYTVWDIAYRYELEGEVIHSTSESYEDEYDYYPAEYWVDNPEYSYPDGEINVTGTNAPSEDFE